MSDVLKLTQQVKMNLNQVSGPSEGCVMAATMVLIHLRQWQCQQKYLGGTFQTQTISRDSVVVNGSRVAGSNGGS